jgi:hypothetical protein
LTLYKLHQKTLAVVLPKDIPTAGGIESISLPFGRNNPCDQEMTKLPVGISVERGAGNPRIMNGSDERGGAKLGITFD